MPNTISLVRDALLTASKALPTAAGTTTSDGIAVLGRSCPVEVAVDIPALTATIVPDTKTATFTVEAATDAAFTSPVTVASIVLTGAGGVGAAATQLRAAVHQNYGYVRGKCVLGATTGDGSALSYTVAVLAKCGC